MAERERIARDLHDTLLQSFHGLLLKFQKSSCLLARSRPRRPLGLRSTMPSTRSRRGGMQYRVCGP
jgi:signal transduction histidine kinase